MLKIAWSEIYAHPVPDAHRFPMLIYELIPKQLLHEGVITPANLFEPAPLEEEIILWTHDRDYWHKLKNLTLTDKEIRKIGLPFSARLVEREQVICRGTIDCALYALEYGVAFNVAGGTHHAYTNRGEGFCLLNDFAIAANYLLRKKLVQKILIIDLDVHQGNGTAQIFANNPAVFCFSMHGKENYPAKKELSDWDIELPTGIKDAEYLAIVKSTLPELVRIVQPDFAFFLAGVDILETDKLGKLCVSMEGCRQRDALVFNTLKQHSIPAVVSMGGGYSPRIADIVDAHCNTFKEAIRTYF